MTHSPLYGSWGKCRLEALRHAMLSGADPVLPSSFAVGTAAQVSIAAAALAACELGHARGQIRQDVHVDMLHAALECVGWFSVDGRVPEVWDKFSGLYRCADGWVRVHANFAHHRDGALRLLGLPPETAQRADAERALQGWRALDFEQAAADHGLVVAALRRFDEWDAHPQGQVVAAQPLLTFERIGDAPPTPLPRLQPSQRPAVGPQGSRSHAHSCRASVRADIGGLWGRRDAGQRTPSSEHRIDCYYQPWQAVCARRSAYRERASRSERSAGKHPRLGAKIPARRAGCIGIRPARARAAQIGPRLRVAVGLRGRGTVARAPRIRLVGPDGDGLQSRRGRSRRRASNPSRCQCRFSTTQRAI